MSDSYAPVIKSVAGNESQADPVQSLSTCERLGCQRTDPKLIDGPGDVLLYLCPKCQEMLRRLQR